MRSYGACLEQEDDVIEMRILIRVVVVRGL